MSLAKIKGIIYSTTDILDVLKGEGVNVLTSKVMVEGVVMGQAMVEDQPEIVGVLNELDYVLDFALSELPKDKEIVDVLTIMYFRLKEVKQKLSVKYTGGWCGDDIILLREANHNEEYQSSKRPYQTLHHL